MEVNEKISNMKIFKKTTLISLTLIIISCNNDHKIIRLLQSSEKEDIIYGAYLAGESNEKKFVPLLLDSAADPRRSTNLRFLGISIYQSKMGALSKILKKEPPVKLTRDVDSVIIKFYIDLAKEDSAILKE